MHIQKYEFVADGILDEYKMLNHSKILYHKLLV